MAAKPVNGSSSEPPPVAPDSTWRLTCVVSGATSPPSGPPLGACAATSLSWLSSRTLVCGAAVSPPPGWVGAGCVGAVVCVGVVVCVVGVVTPGGATY